LPQRVWKRAWVWPQLRMKVKPVHILGRVCGGGGGGGSGGGDDVGGGG
jgi:hypothetical protein